jgi:lysophospholipase L1-like esterase
MRIASLALMPLLAWGSAAAGEAVVLDSMDQPTFRAGGELVKVTQVPGLQGQALHFAFAADARGVFATGRVRGAPAWDQAAGISFRVKGDGSATCGGIQFVWNEDYGIRYDAAFPISGSEWTTVTIPWRDFIPVLATPASIPLDPHGERPPSKLGQLWFGKWWYWGDYAAHGYAIDDIRLEPVIPLAEAPPPAGAPLARVQAKLKAGKPLTVVTMGDSLTDLRHWTNRQTNWPAYLAAQLAQEHGSVATLVNPAIGGTELRQNLVLIPRWLAQAPHPDLVTVCFGHNDWNSGMRGAAFRATLLDAVRRIRLATGGSADVLLITSMPSLPLWEPIDELAEACRQAAKEANAGLCDGFAIFNAVPATERAKLFVDDRVHLAPAGQQALARAVAAALAAPRP